MDNSGLIKTLSNEFPKQFHDGDTVVRSTYPKGWYHIIRTVLKRVDAARLPIKWAQIKEKLGSLRMYEDADEGHSQLVELYDWIGEAERLSRITCQCCGNKGEQVILRGWKQVLCGSCKKEQEAH